MKRLIVEPRDLLGTHAASDPFESTVRRAARGERHLLLEDDLNQRLEAGRPIPQRWRSVASDDRGKVRVPARELRYAFGERLGCELERHLNLTSRDPAM